MAYTIFTINETAWVFSPQKFNSLSNTKTTVAARSFVSDLTIVSSCILLLTFMKSG